MSEKVQNITMDRDTLLVIFEYLSRSYKEWKKGGDQPDNTFSLANPDAGERVALWRLEGEIERTLPEIFSADYEQLIADEKRRLTADLYGAERQES